MDTKKTNTLLLIVLTIISVSLLVKIFQFDSETKEIKTELNKLSKNLTNAIRVSKDAEKDIDAILEKIKSDYQKEIDDLNTKKNEIINNHNASKKKRTAEVKKISKKIKDAKASRNKIIKALEDDED